MTTTSAPVVDQAAAERFLREERFALVGASDDPKSFSRTGNRELTARDTTSCL